MRPKQPTVMPSDAQTFTAPFEALVPRPTVLHFPGGTFTFPRTFRISAPGGASFWLEPLEQEFARLGRGVETHSETESRPVLSLRLDENVPAGRTILEVRDFGIVISSRDTQGLIVGVQRLRAILRVIPSGTAVVLPLVHMEDAPRYAWRAMHLDCARHFMPVDFLLSFLDRMSLLGYNLFHWHLTDDQGWRLEIPAFPRLTEVGSVRARTHVGKLASDGSPVAFNTEAHGGFYSSSDVAVIIAHATARGITVMPEIEMPGHATAALAAYPEWGCTGRTLEVADYWGIFPNLLCAGNDRVLRALEEILGEVTKLFPSRYIHLGGDECPLGNWDACPRCQDRVRREGLGDSHGLHAWFFRHFQAFLRERGRTMVVWDDVLDAGTLDEDAIIMCWRDSDAVQCAAKRGHRVINCAHSDTYFNKYQTEDRESEGIAYDGYLPLERVLAFQPAGGAVLPADRILGAQGHLWSEYMPTTADVDRMAFPRVSALIERLWSEGPVPSNRLDLLKKHAELLSPLACS